MTVAVWNVVLQPDESTIGFASRVAAHFGMPLTRFFKYKGVDYPKFRHKDIAQVERFASQWSLDVDVLMGRMWDQHAKWPWYGDITNKYEYFEWTRPRYCPVCVVEDSRDGLGVEEARPWQRLAWLSPMVSVCCRHGVRLRHTPPEISKLVPGDFSLAISSRFDEVVAEAANPDAADVGTADTYFHDRMVNPWDRTEFLDQMDTCAAYEVCKAFGRLHAPVKPNGTREEVQRGYDIVRAGEGAVIAYLDGILDFGLHEGRRTKRSVYGDVYALIAYTKNPGRFGPLVSIIREHGLSRLPLAADEDFLGPVGQRRFHSVRSAAVEHGVVSRNLRMTLMRHGMIAEADSDKLDGDILIPVEVADEFMGKMAVPLITLAELRKRTKIAAATVGALLEAGHLTKAGFTSHVVLAAEEVERFLSRLFDGRQYRAAGGQMIDIWMAFRKVAIPVHELILMTLEGKITAYSNTKARSHSIASLLFDEAQLVPFSRHVSQGGGEYLTSGELEEFLGTSYQTVKNLFDTGALSLIKGDGVAKLTRTSEARAFKERFVSLAEVCRLASGSFWATKPWLAENGVAVQISFQDPNAATFYVREEVMALIATGSRPRKLQMPRRSGQSKARRGR